MRSSVCWFSLFGDALHPSGAGILGVSNLVPTNPILANLIPTDLIPTDLPVSGGTETARLQALASDFWPVLGGAIVRTGNKSDPRRCGWGERWVVAYTARNLTHSPSLPRNPPPARLQALASDFWPVLGGSIVRMG